MLDYSRWNGISQQIRATCAVFDQEIVKRRRRFDTYSVVSSVMELSSGPNRSYLNVLHEFDSEQRSPAASSFCKARKKVPASVFSEVRADLLENWRDDGPEDVLWHGFRSYAMDGSKLNVPRELKDEGFYVSPCSFYPHALLTGLLRISDRMVCDLDFSSHLSEREAGRRLLSNLNHRDLVIYDKGYLSFDYLYEHNETGVEGLFKVQGGQSFREIVEFRESSSEDRIVEILPSDHARRKSQKARPDFVLKPLRLRLIKYKIDEIEHILATTILDTSIPAKDFIELYQSRWKIEELYKSFKNTLIIEEFHSKNANGVEQELQAASVAWNISRMIEAFAPPDFKKSG